MKLKEKIIFLLIGLICVMIFFMQGESDKEVSNIKVGITEGISNILIEETLKIYDESNVILEELEMYSFEDC